MIDHRLAKRISTAAQKGKDWLLRRDDLIVEAVKSGATQAEVAQVAGLSQAGVHDIVRRHNQ